MEGFSFILARAFEFFSLMDQSRHLGHAALNASVLVARFPTLRCSRQTFGWACFVEIVISFHGALALSGGCQSSVRPLQLGRRYRFAGRLRTWRDFCH